MRPLPPRGLRQLPDGSVVTGGGKGDNDPPSTYEDCWHSVEFYKPPYFFQPRGRPKITSHTASNPESWGSTFDINVSKLYADIDEFRVALLAPTTGTHNTDFNQRYVELKVTQFVGDPITKTAFITVEAPENENVAPPGMYMLTVVDKNGIPSRADWVWIDE